MWCHLFEVIKTFSFCWSTINDLHAADVCISVCFSLDAWQALYSAWSAVMLLIKFRRLPCCLFSEDTLQVVSWVQTPVILLLWCRCLLYCWCSKDDSNAVGFALTFDIMLMQWRCLFMLFIWCMDYHAVGVLYVILRRIPCLWWCVDAFYVMYMPLMFFIWFRGL